MHRHGIYSQNVSLDFEICITIFYKDNFKKSCKIYCRLEMKVGSAYFV